MRNVLFLVGMSVVITVVWAQENKSVDPAWLFVPESVEGEEFVAIEPVMGSDFPVELRELLGSLPLVSYQRPVQPIQDCFRF